MSVRGSGQFSFVDALMPQGGGGRLERLSGLVKWYRFEKLLARVREETSLGRPAYPPLTMFKALLLQSLYACPTRSSKKHSWIGCRSSGLSGWRWMRRCRIIRRCAATATF